MTAIPKVRYKEYRLLAVDMTTFGLPPYKAVTEALKSPKDNKKRSAKPQQATLPVLWDIGTNSPVEWRLEACYSSARFAAHDMIEKRESGDLILANRGYPSRKMFIDIDNRHAKYLIRMPPGKAGGFREVREFALDITQLDSEILLHVNRLRKGEPTIRVRLMKHRLPKGEIAVFADSAPRSGVSP
jgi:hypothetical protein